MTPRLKDRLAKLRQQLAKELDRARAAVNDTGLDEVIAIGKELEGFLANHKGDARFTPEAIAASNSLHRRYKSASAKALAYDPIATVNKAIEAEFLLADFDRYFWGVLGEKP